MQSLQCRCYAVLMWPVTAFMATVELIISTPLLLVNKHGPDMPPILPLLGFLIFPWLSPIWTLIFMLPQVWWPQIFNVIAKLPLFDFLDDAFPHVPAPADTNSQART